MRALELLWGEWMTVNINSLFVLHHKVISDFEQVRLIKYSDQIINQMWLIVEQFEMRNFYFAYQICTLYDNMY